MKRFFGHLKKVIKHKYYVGKYCFMCGLYWQGLTHDLSKFSPTEFWESVKYYQGTRSPIDACKEENGYSMAWFHHRGRNKHHWEYWVDDFEKGVVPKKMPFKYALELICDYMGAGNAYWGDKFTMKSEYDWWVNTKREKAGPYIHPQTLAFIDTMFTNMLIHGIEGTLTNKEFIKELKGLYERDRL